MKRVITAAERGIGKKENSKGWWSKENEAAIQAKKKCVGTNDQRGKTKEGSFIKIDIYSDVYSEVSLQLGQERQLC